MYFRINEVSTIAATGNTYVHVDFWRRKADFDAAQPPYLTNSWSMHLRPLQGVRRRKDGFLERTDGSYVSPAAALAVPYGDFKYEKGWNTRQLILDAIADAWKAAMHHGFSGDWTADTTKPLKRLGALVKQTGSTVPVRDNSDPHRVLERSDIVSLRGHKKEERNL